MVTCDNFSKVCKSVAGLKRHMLVLRETKLRQTKFMFATSVSEVIKVILVLSIIYELIAKGSGINDGNNKIFNKKHEKVTN